MADPRELKELLESYGVRANEKLGQNFLIDEDVIRYLASQVWNGVHVVEIGAGLGQVTAALAARAGSLTALEIDDRYEPFLSQISQQYPNVRVKYGDVINMGLEPLMNNKNENQVVSNLPFHIIEPMVWLLADKDIVNAVLMIGDNAASVLMARETEGIYGKMSFIAQAFFEIDRLCDVSKDSFYPVPRTHATIVQLTPKEEPDAIAAKLVRTAHRSPLVVNILKEAIVDQSTVTRRGTLGKREGHQRDRSRVRYQTKQWVQELKHTGDIDFQNQKSDIALDQTQALRKIQEAGLGSDVLQKPFIKLDNPAIRKLVAGLRVLDK